MSAAILPVTAGNPPNNTSKHNTLADGVGQQQCCNRFLDELRHRHDAFSQHEVYDSNGSRGAAVIDGPSSFAPAGRWTLFVKTFLTIWAASSLVDGIMEDYYIGHRAFYLAYLTHWSLIVSVTYLLFSWMNTVQTTTAAATKNTTTNQQQSASITMFHKITWALFVLAGPAEVVVAIGYWALEWDGTSDAFYYRNFMVHGVIVAIVLVDGLLINKIPVLATHFVWNASYFTLYFIWTIIHDLFTDIGNPTTPEEDDTLYVALQWKSDPFSTLLTAAQMLFLLVPFAFVVVYSLSLYSFPCGGLSGSSRRYCTIDPSNTTTNTTVGKRDDQTITSSYVEMSGSVSGRPYTNVPQTV